MNKRVAYSLVLVVILAAIVFGSWSYISGDKRAGVSYMDAEYVIEGELVKLQGGVAEEEIAPGSASKKITRYFGNELKTDLNGDGREDVTFVLTQETGGSGIFFYAVAALATDQGYIGSDGYFLGDRVAPQTTEIHSDSRQEPVVVFNYADRVLGEPMAARPSVNKSVYLKLDTALMRWNTVEPILPE